MWAPQEPVPVFASSLPSHFHEDDPADQCLHAKARARRPAHRTEEPDRSTLPRSKRIPPVSSP
jgi:hypothetical protein